MNKKLTKTFIRHYNVCFLIVKALVNGFQFFLKMTFFTKFLTWALIK